MVKNGKFFLAPPLGDGDFKSLFQFVFENGIGRSVDENGLVVGPWSTEALAEAMTLVDAQGKGVDIRLVQLWLQDNSRGIGSYNARLLALVIGCDDQSATHQWLVEILSSNAALSKNRRHGASIARSNQNVEEIEKPKSVSEPTATFDLAKSIERPYGDGSNSLAIWVVAGSATLAFVTFLFGVHDVVYEPLDGLQKQVGYLWAPNWTVLHLFLLPLFIILLSTLIYDWKTKFKGEILEGMSAEIVEQDWNAKVQLQTSWFWAALFISGVAVFLLQWVAGYLQILISGDITGSVVDWGTIAVSQSGYWTSIAAGSMTLFAFAYTGATTFVYLSGLTLLYSLIVDYSQAALEADWERNKHCRRKVVEVGEALLRGTSRCVSLGIFMSVCLTLQATYLVSGGENILLWLVDDAFGFLGFSDKEVLNLDYRTLTKLASFLACLVTVSIFIACIIRIFWVFKLVLPTGSRTPWIGLSANIVAIVAMFLCIGFFEGFSLVFSLGLLLACFNFYDPLFGRKNSLS